MDFEKAPADLLAEIVRQAEARLGVQTQFALAADQRALSLTNLYGSMTVALFAGAIAALGEDLRPIAAAAAAAGLMTFLATVLVAMAARPAPFATVGNDPASWEDDINSGRPLHGAMADTARIYDEALKNNRTRMKGQSRLIVWALTMMLLAGPVAAGAGLAVYYFLP